MHPMGHLSPPWLWLMENPPVVNTVHLLIFERKCVHHHLCHTLTDVIHIYYFITGSSVSDSFPPWTPVLICTRPPLASVLSTPPSSDGPFTTIITPAMIVPSNRPSSNTCKHLFPTCPAPLRPFLYIFPTRAALSLPYLLICQQPHVILCHSALMKALHVIHLLHLCPFSILTFPCHMCCTRASHMC